MSLSPQLNGIGDLMAQRGNSLSPSWCGWPQAPVPPLAGKELIARRAPEHMRKRLPNTWIAEVIMNLPVIDRSSWRGETGELRLCFKARDRDHAGRAAEFAVVIIRENRSCGKRIAIDTGRAGRLGACSRCGKSRARGYTPTTTEIGMRFIETASSSHHARIWCPGLDGDRPIWIRNWKGSAAVEIVPCCDLQAASCRPTRQKGGMT